MVQNISAELSVICNRCIHGILQFNQYRTFCRLFVMHRVKSIVKESNAMSFHKRVWSNRVNGFNRDVHFCLPSLIWFTNASSHASWKLWTLDTVTMSTQCNLICDKEPRGTSASSHNRCKTGRLPSVRHRHFSMPPGRQCQCVAKTLSKQSVANVLVVA